MKNLTKYIQNLKFEYAVSYSGLRGEKYTNLVLSTLKKIEEIEKDIQSTRFMQKPKLIKEIDKLKDRIDLCNSRIITSNNEFHPSTIQIRRFEKSDKDISDIMNILKTEVTMQGATMCAPIFRDALVFYSEKNEIKGILQVCFSCNSIKNENEESLEADYKMYEKLKRKLIQIGHAIENT